MSDTTKNPPTGLVLSGGGAKGAYQVGVLKALLELGASIDMVAGASMGALNGAVLACAPSLPEGVQRLETLWNTLAAQSPVAANSPGYLKLLAAAGLALGTPLPGVLAQIPTLTQSMRWIEPAMQLTGDWLETALMSDGPLKALMDEYLDTEGLMRGLPLYVSVFESRGGLADLLRCTVAEAGLADTPPSRFVHIQSLPAQERRNALLASAAIPLLYQARQIGDARYSDGGQGGWQTAQGNTPITPLIDAGCKQVIVTHLTDGALWSRHDFPDTTVLEIRPQTPITPNGSLLGAAKAALGFDLSNISRLIEQGYQDTMHCVGRVMKASKSRQAVRDSECALDDSLQRGNCADAALTDAMSRLQ
jgi:NTE family protein